ncbi:MAG: peptidyl-prolyl cis-trans isomerase [Thiogranum sp.]|nr:peptidyl-prolyl cis-trans isomerase [Thiogranum sp.]
MKIMLGFVSALLMLPVCATGTVAGDAKAQAAAATDVIARVGDQTIRFGEINTALNSSAIVGVSIPALGTPERDTARIILLDRFVSANLLYLDALRQGVDKDPAYTKAVTRFSNAILAGLYRQQRQAGDIPVSEEQVKAYAAQHLPPDAQLSDDLRLQIEATLRRQQLHERMQAAAKHLRDDVKVVVHTENLEISGDGQRAGSTPLAEVGDETITWGEMNDRIIGAGKGALQADPMAFEAEARSKALQGEIDLRIMVQKARAAGLEQDPVYQRRLHEYSKTLLINQHRVNLAKTMEPSDEALRSYYEANRDRFMVPEARKVQMVVLESEAQALQIKDSIEKGELTLYQAARDYSIAPNARQDLGELGWVNRGRAAPPLDELIFALEPGKVGGPVASPAGWNLVAVLEVNEGKYTEFDDATTRSLTRRRYLHDELDAYTAQLRKEQFKVEVYQDRLLQLAQQEADMVERLAQQAQEPGSVTQTRIKELQKIMKP